MERQPCVYILSNHSRTVLYVGVTTHLAKRLWEHRQGLVDSFTRRYRVYDLIYYEVTADITSAIQREKRLKRWRRSWKNTLISEFNPHWRDLATDIS